MTRRYPKLQLEALEDRTVPSTLASSPKPPTSIGGYSISNVKLSGGTLEGDVKLPLVNVVHLKGTYSTPSHFSLTGQLASVTVGGFVLSHDSITLDDHGIAFAGAASVTQLGLGPIQLNGTITDAGNYSFSAHMATLSVAGFQLNNDDVTLGNKGLKLSAHATLPVVGGVTFAGSVSASGALDVSATRDPFSLLNGQIQLNNLRMDLKPNVISVSVHGNVGQIVQADFKGAFYTDGHYSLTAKATLKLAGFALDAANLDMGPNQLSVKVTVPVPGIAVPVSLEGSLGSSGRWSLAATLPGTVMVGDFPLHDLKFALSNDAMTLAARTGIPNILDAGVAGQVFYDGRYQLTVDANAVSLGGFRLANTVVTLGNNYTSRTFRMEIHAAAGIPYGPNVKLDGFLDAHSHYDLAGTANLSVLGFTLNTAHFTLNDRAGFSFDADWNYVLFVGHVNGTITEDSHVRFHGDALFVIRHVHVDADLDLQHGTKKINIY